MPPLGEHFKPTTELNELEVQQKAEIDAKRAEIGQRMEELCPEYILSKRGRKLSGRSATANYSHPDLPSDQLMEAYLDRRFYPRSGEFIMLTVRPVYAHNLKAVCGRAYDEKAYHSDAGTTLQISGFFASGNFDSFGYDQKIELIGQYNDTLDLIKQANEAQDLKATA